MQDIKSEDAIVLIDTSRSMLRKDFKPSRLYIALQAAKIFIEQKFKIDPRDRIALVSFGDTVKKNAAFTYVEERLVESLKKLKVSGIGSLHDALAFSLQLLVEEMRKLGGKVHRIFIISDNKFEQSLKIEKLMNICKGLGIYIDACELGKGEDHSDSVLKKISKMTGGQYGYFNNSKAISNAVKAFASKKEFKDSFDYFGPDKKKGLAPLISEIALPLRRPSVLDIRSMMSDRGKGKGQDKCQICHSVKAPLTQADFYSEGRFCPSCDRPMHLSCAAMWAKKTEYKDNVFRCPFCYFLVELPKSASMLINENSEPEPKIKLIDTPSSKTTKMILISENEVEDIDASCTYCHSIFLGDYRVFQCEKCGVYYHEPCLQKLNSEFQACRNCGSKIVFS